jgi:hypothetical protein
MKHPPAIPTEGRLNLLLQRHTQHTHNATLIAKLAPDATTKLEPHHQRRYQPPADTRTLRGIPAIGRGVAGCIPGMNPDRITRI